MANLNTINCCNSFKDNIKKLEKIIEPQSLRDFFITKYFKENLSCEQIASTLGISESSVRRYMRYLNIDIRYSVQIMRLFNEHEKLVNGVEYTYDDAIRELKERWKNILMNSKNKKQGVDE